MGKEQSREKIFCIDKEVSIKKLFTYMYNLNENFFVYDKVGKNSQYSLICLLPLVELRESAMNKMCVN